MIDSITKLFEKLVEFGQIKERNKERYFKNFVEPLFQDAEKVANDYIVLFSELISKLKHQESVPEVIGWIEDKRRELLLVRIKLRGTVKIYFPEDQKKNKFEHGIWWLLRGGLTFVEEGHVEFNDGKLLGQHTVLDLLYACSQEPIKMNRSTFVRRASQQLKCVEDAWHEINEGYAEIKKKYMG